MSIIEGVTNNVYDCLMLPPDEDTEKNIFGKLKEKFVHTFKKFVGRYYNSDMVKSFESETIEIMFYEIYDDNAEIRFNNFQVTKKYLSNVINSIQNFYRGFYGSYGYNPEETRIKNVKISY